MQGGAVEGVWRVFFSNKGGFPPGRFEGDHQPIGQVHRLVQKHLHGRQGRGEEVTRGMKGIARVGFSGRCNGARSC